MADIFRSAERVKSRASLPGSLVRGREYFIENEGVILLDLGDGPHEYGGKGGGSGVPDGGTTGQVLTKNSDTDGDAEWKTPAEPESPVLDTLAGDEVDKAPSVRAVKEALETKADLVDGKVPLSQLPPGGAGPSVEVIDALTSNRADAALSARQGKVLAELIDGGVPRGFIGMWSGQLSEIPSGWALCDGQDGRPNLLGKFIRGVPSTTTNPGGAGGSDTMTLSEANLPAHAHNVNTETVGHSHTIPGLGQGMLKVGGNQNTPAIIADQFGTPTSTVKDRINASSSMVGGGQAFDNRPAYYELAYIIKL